MRIQRQDEMFSWRFSKSWWTNRIAAKNSQELADLEYLHRMGYLAGVDSRSTHGKFDRASNTVLWTPERKAQHEFASKLFLGTGGPENPHLRKTGINGVPREGRALVLSGLPGSGKTSILQHDAVRKSLNPQQFFSINPDPHKYLYSHLGMVPTQEEIIKAMHDPEAVNSLIENGQDPEEVFYRLSHMDSRFTPGDLTPFVHEEASAQNKIIRDELMENNYNIIFDGTLPNGDKARKLLTLLRNAGYDRRSGLMVNASYDPARRRAGSRFDSGDDNYGQPDKDWAPLASLLPDSPITGGKGLGHGGRYVPEFFSEQNRPKPNTPYRSGSHAAYLEINDPENFPDGSAIFDADRDLRPDPKTGKKPPPLLMGGHGPIFNSILQSGGVEYNPNTHEGYRMAKRIMADDQQDIYTNSAQHIMREYRRGQIDFDTLTSLLVQRAQHIKQNGNPEPDWRAFECSENMGHDDIFRIIDGAEYRGTLSSDEAEEIRSQVASIIFGVF